MLGAVGLADLPRLIGAAVVKLVYTQHLKCCERKLMSVRLRPAAPIVRGTQGPNAKNYFFYRARKSYARKSMRGPKQMALLWAGKALGFSRRKSTPATQH